MLIEVEPDYYKKLFPLDPHPFVSSPFIELNKLKVDKLVWLVEDTEKPGIGLIAGLKDGKLLSPFSAPFGGFHFRKEIMYINEIDNFLDSLKIYISSNKFSGIDITLPPDIYHQTFNAKTVSSLIRSGFKPSLPEITNWVNLAYFNGIFSQKNSKEYYRQALRNELSFAPSYEESDKEILYELIYNNRKQFGRPIFMTLNDIRRTSELWPIDFFKVLSADKQLVASAIFYRSHPEICYALFWGDNELGRPLRAMDFLAFKLWSYYKELGYKFIDLGISTESGIPNEGLLRFKESHESISSVRFKFKFEV